MCHTYCTVYCINRLHHCNKTIMKTVPILILIINGIFYQIIHLSAMHQFYGIVPINNVLPANIILAIIDTLCTSMSMDYQRDQWIIFDFSKEHKK